MTILSFVLDEVERLRQQAIKLLLEERAALDGKLSQLGHDPDVDNCQPFPATNGSGRKRGRRPRVNGVQTTIEDVSVSEPPQQETVIEQ